MEGNSVVLRRKLNIFFAICMTALYSLYCFVLVPLSIMYSNDVVYKDTLLPTVTEIIYDAVEIIAISLGYAVSVYSIYRYGLSKTVPSMILFCVITLFKYVSNLLMDWRGGDFLVSRLASDIVVILIPLLLEILQYFIVIWITNKVIISHEEKMTARKRTAETGESLNTDRDMGVYPFRGAIDKSNPLMRIALWAGLVIIITGLLQSIPYFYIVSSAYGFPIWSVISHVLTVTLEGILCYFTMLTLWILFFQYKNKRELYENL